MNKKTKQVSISVDKEIWDRFVKKVESVEGKTYGKIGPTLTNLINEYYLSDSEDDSDTKKINELTDKLNEKSDYIDNLLLEKKELTKENSTLTDKLQKKDNDMEKLKKEVDELTRTYESTLEDNEKYNELLSNLEDKVLELSNENQRLINEINIKTNEKNDIYIEASKNEKKLKNLNSKYKNQIKKLKDSNKMLLKRFKNAKRDKNKLAKPSKRDIDANESIPTQNQQLLSQYEEYMKQFENIKRR